MCSSPHWQVGSNWFREKLSPANRNKGYRGEQISRKIVSRELNARSYRDFAKNIALLGATSAKFAKSVGKKMGSNMRPRYIQFRDIHDRDISGLHCTYLLQSTIFQHCFRWWLGADQATSHYLNQWWLVYWCIMHHSASILVILIRLDIGVMTLETMWKVSLWVSVSYTALHHINGLLQGYSISNALAMEILQSCTNPSILFWLHPEIW